MAEVFFFEGDDALIQFKDFFGRLVEVLIVVATLVIGSGGDGMERSYVSRCAGSTLYISANLYNLETGHSVLPLSIME